MDAMLAVWLAALMGISMADKWVDMTVVPWVE